MMVIKKLSGQVRDDHDQAELAQDVWHYGVDPRDHGVLKHHYK